MFRLSVKRFELFNQVIKGFNTWLLSMKKSNWDERTTLCLNVLYKD